MDLKLIHESLGNEHFADQEILKNYLDFFLNAYSLVKWVPNQKLIVVFIILPL